MADNGRTVGGTAKDGISTLVKNRLSILKNTLQSRLLQAFYRRIRWSSYSKFLNRMVKKEFELRAGALNDPLAAATHGLNAGIFLNSLGQHEKAFECINKACAEFNEIKGNYGVAFCDINIGLIHLCLGRFEEAYQCMTQGHDSFEAYGKDNHEANNYAAQAAMCIGITLNASGKYKEAFQYFRRASCQLTISDEDVGIINEIRCLLEHCFFYGNPEQALRDIRLYRENAIHFAFSPTITSSWNVKGHEGVGRTDLVIATYDLITGEFLCFQFRYQEAIEHFNQARTVYEACGMGVKVAGCNLGIGVSLIGMCEYQEAITHLTQARKVFDQHSDIIGVGRCCMNIGLGLSNLGQAKEAIASFKEAQKEFAKRGQPVLQEAFCDLFIAQELTTLKQLKDAQSHYLRARRALIVSGDDQAVGMCDLLVCNLLFTFPEIGKEFLDGEVIKRVNNALSTFKRMGADAMPVCEMSLGQGLHVLGRYAESIHHLKQARSEWATRGYDLYASLCDAVIASSFMELAKISAYRPTAEINFSYRSALSHLDSAISIVEEFRYKLTVPDYLTSFHERHTYAYMAAVECSLRLGRPVKALEFLERSRSQTLAAVLLCHLTPDPAEVNQMLCKEFFRVRNHLRHFSPSPLSLLRAGAGPMFGGENLGGVAESQSSVKQQFDYVLQQIITQHPDARFTELVTEGRETYLKSLAEYQDLVPDEHSAIVDFLTWGEEKLRAFLITRKGVEMLTFPEGSLGEIYKIVTEWVKLFENDVDLESNKKIVWRTCRQLYEAIFAAEVDITLMTDAPTAEESEPTFHCTLLAHLDNCLPVPALAGQQSRRLYIIPHGLLSMLPLHAACRDGSTANGAVNGSSSGQDIRDFEDSFPRYVLEDYEVIYTPSAYLLKLSLERARRPMPESDGARKRALVVGNPLPLPKEYGSLEWATGEAQEVYRQLDGAGWDADLLVENDATKEMFLKGGSLPRPDRHTTHTVGGLQQAEYDLVYTSMHHDIEWHDIPESYLVFGQPSGGGEYRCYGHEIAATWLPKTECAFMAGCKTNMTAPWMSEYIGTGAAFLRAGARNVVGTLYPLNDLGSRKLVPHLFKIRLSDGLDWPAALRRAQTDMLKGLMAGDEDTEITSDNAQAARVRGPATSAIQQGQVETSVVVAHDFRHPYYWAGFMISGAE